MIKAYGQGAYDFVPFPQKSLKIEIGDYIADYTKFQHAVGWTPKTSLEDGLRKTFDYYSKYKQYYW